MTNPFQNISTKTKRIVDKVINWIFYIQFSAISLFALWVILRLFVIDTYIIPSESMEPTLIPGDRVMVNKLCQGGRLYKSLDFFETGEDPEIIRTHAFAPIRNNDVVVFNFPYARGWDSIHMNPQKFYCKRCIATPGDTLSIVDGFYTINGEKGFGHMENQAMLKGLCKDTVLSVSKTAYPMHPDIKWTILNFGPMLIPKIGSTIEMNKENFVIYNKMITYETKGVLTWTETKESNICTLNGTPISNYTFTQDWFFMGGDALYNSQDSRYFGPIPEPFISGRVTRILWSKERRDGGNYRHDRFFKVVK